MRTKEQCIKSIYGTLCDCEACNKEWVEEKKDGLEDKGP